MKNRIVYFGTPSFAAEILRYLFAREVPIVAVVTQPDRPRGRSLLFSASPVKEAALEIAPDVPIFQPEKASEDKFLEDLRNLNADLFVVVAYGQILSQKLLSIPPLGSINVHPSLLPKYRGATPIQSCLLNGDRETGVSIQKIVRQVDAGDVIASEKIAIPDNATFGELESVLADLSKKMLLNVIKSFENGIPLGEVQNHEEATFCSKIEITQAKISWDESSQKIHNQIRAFSPKPGAWCWLELGKKRLKILRAKLAQGKGSPGEILSPQGLIACGEGALQLIEVQPEGKRVMAASDWLRGVLGVAKLN